MFFLADLVTTKPTVVLSSAARFHCIMNRSGQVGAATLCKLSRRKKSQCSSSFRRSTNHSAIVQQQRAIMPRVLPGQSAGKLVETEVLVAKTTSKWKDGTYLLYIGYIGLGVLGVDRYLQYSQSLDANEMILSVVEEQRRTKRKLMEDHKSSPILYTAIITQQYKGMGGSYGLEPAPVVGSTVHILEEHVGPDQSYCLCRCTTNASGESQEQQQQQVGWYPIKFMKKQSQRERYFFGLI